MEALGNVVGIGRLLRRLYLRHLLSLQLSHPIPFLDRVSMEPWNFDAIPEHLEVLNEPLTYMVTNARQWVHEATMLLRLAVIETDYETTMSRGTYKMYDILAKAAKERQNVRWAPSK